jgi:hypothetical protein
MILRININYFPDSINQLVFVMETECDFCEVGNYLDEEYDLLGVKAMWFGRIPPMFRRNVSFPSSGSNSKSSKKPAIVPVSRRRIAGFLFGLYVDLDGGGDTFLQNVG